MAAAEKISSSHVSRLLRLLRLTLVVPAIVEVILDGRQPDELARPALMQPFPAK